MSDCLLLSAIVQRDVQRDQRKREESRNLIVLFELRKPSKRILKFVPRQNSVSKAKDFALIVVRKIIDLSQRPSQVRVYYNSKFCPCLAGVNAP